MIRPWGEGDIEQLRPMVHGFLREVIARGGDIADTENNCATYIGLGLGAAARGEPTTVWDEGGKLLSLCLWSALPSIFEFTKRTMFAVGAFTLPEARGHLCAKLLRDHAVARTWELGFDRIVGPIQTTNARGQQVMASYGAWPISSNWELWRA